MKEMQATYTFDDHIVSDLHKDALGFRPGQAFWNFWSTATDDEKQAEWDSLLAALERTMEQERQEQARAVEEFNAMLRRLYETGAKDFEQALQWTHDAHNTNGDDEYLEFVMGLPFGYIAWAKK